MTYQEQLLDQRWIILRDTILNRDHHECQVCTSRDNLHVHHKKYINGKLAWEYPVNLLITLCNNCHSLVHDKPIREKVMYKREKTGIQIIQEVGKRMQLSLQALRRLDAVIAEKERLKKNG